VVLATVLVGLGELLEAVPMITLEVEGIVVLATVEGVVANVVFAEVLVTAAVTSLVVECRVLADVVVRLFIIVVAGALEVVLNGHGTV